jgi:hypothetical protein
MVVMIGLVLMVVWEAIHFLPSLPIELALLLITMDYLDQVPSITSQFFLLPPIVYL